jgi:hypothetical protein
MPGAEDYGRPVVLAPGVLVRPIAEGCIALTVGGRPEYLAPLDERILSVCVRPTGEGELADLLSDMHGRTPQDTNRAIRNLVAGGVLRAI